MSFFLCLHVAKVINLEIRIQNLENRRVGICIFVKISFSMHFISEELENYVAQHSQVEPELLVKLNKETHQKILQPRMLSGHFQGRVLSMLSKLIRPKSDTRNRDLYGLCYIMFG